MIVTDSCWNLLSHGTLSHLHRLMDNIKDLLDESLFFQLLLFVIFIALSLFCIDQNMERMDVNAILSFNLLVSQALFNSLFSYFSDIVSDQSSAIGWYAYNMHWYEMPIKQRYFIEWIIRRAQKPLIITGARIVPSSMETMGKACGNVTFREESSDKE